LPIFALNADCRLLFSERDYRIHLRRPARRPIAGAGFRERRFEMKYVNIVRLEVVNERNDLGTGF
jgi:hypothetical protein